MNKALKRFITAYFCLFLLMYYAWPASGETAAEEARKLLEKGLTIHEIDRELSRLSGLEAEIEIKIAENETRIGEQEERVELKRDAAGKVLRSYYMGQRERLYLAILTLDNLYDAIMALDYLRIIFNHDQRLLHSYKESLDVLNNLQAELLASKQELKDVKNLYLAERERLVRMQEELDEELAVLPADESERLRDEIAALTERWETEGIPLMERYFTALAEAMQQLPQIVAANNEVLQIRGTQFIFQISDAQLNEFLRNENELFENMTFQFTDESITVTGSHHDTAVTIVGHYVLEQEPINHIRFVIESLAFNDLSLPDTTINNLEERFDLSIYPDQFELSLEAVEVTMEGNILRIKLKMTGSLLDSLFGNLFS